MNTPERYFAGSVPQGSPTYAVDGASITCLLCGSESFNENDIKQLYCGYCCIDHSLIMVLRRELHDPSGIYPIDLEAGCPDCGGKEFKIGPRGGLNRNVECAGCASRFNMFWGVGVAHRIENNGMPYDDRLLRMI